MVVQDSERTSYDRQNGRMYTVTVKIKFPAEIGPVDNEKVAGRRAQYQVALRERDLEPQKLKVAEVRKTQNDFFSMFNEYEVKVFRPYD